MSRFSGALNRIASGTGRILALALVVLVGAAAVILVVSSDTRQGTAYFASVKSIYPGDRVRIQGVDVGQIDDIQPEGDTVRIDFSWDGDYPVPAEAMAGIVSPTLVATRYLQLAPAYKGGPQLEDGGVIPVERTASPVEYDDLKEQVKRVGETLGPDGLDAQGALSRFVDVAAANAEGGNGEKFNEMIKQASAAVQTLADGREDLFGTVRNLQVFVAGLGAVDGQIAEFNNRLSSVSGVLADSSDDLGAALAGIDRAAGDVEAFVDETGGPLTESVDRLGSVTRNLASSRDELAQVLHVAPSTMMNFFHIFSTRTGAISGGLTIDNLNSPADLGCTAIAGAATENPEAGIEACKSYFGPILQLLRVNPVPVGINPLAVEGGGAPAPPTGPVEPQSPNPQQLPIAPDVPGLGGLQLPEGGN
ncbi:MULTISPECIES: MCE family protein [unclassified Pseudonocardia]|uniref:MCE family protein n=1 Tax=unclassified Pseudonocardia TaxID=2619320 RepID=UPI0001FFE4A7|nr:MCE family protein [Pseudonocardia sp. Ae707_Ps1]OLM16751.1 MCE-family protein Mce1D [Pseudonocardia sp. Ae707_Ps1]